MVSTSGLCVPRPLPFTCRRGGTSSVTLWFYYAECVCGGRVLKMAVSTLLFCLGVQAAPLSGCARSVICRCDVKALGRQEAFVVRDGRNMVPTGGFHLN